MIILWYTSVKNNFHTNLLAQKRYQVFLFKEILVISYLVRKWVLLFFIKRGNAKVRPIRSLLKRLSLQAAVPWLWSLHYIELREDHFSLWSHYTACYYHIEPSGGRSFLVKPNLVFQKDQWKLTAKNAIKNTHRWKSPYVFFFLVLWQHELSRWVKWERKVWMTFHSITAKQVKQPQVIFHLQENIP